MSTTKTPRICDPRSVTSGVIHCLGFALSLIGATVLIVFTAMDGADPWKIVSFSIYGASLIFLYAASSLYHILFVSERVHWILRKVDHCMIYFLIAGTYTPLCLVTLHGRTGWLMLAIVWSMCIMGIVVAAVWIDAPKWLSALCYLFAGWVAVFAIRPLMAGLTVAGVAWLLAGGILYTVGAIFCAAKPLRFGGKYFGEHELFHLFVLAGSACHFWLMYAHVM